MHSDEKLIELFNAGDEQAFDELFDRYRQKLYNFIYRIVDDKEDAMDLVQETFISVYTSLYRWQPKARFSTWLYTIAVNKARTELRKTRRHIKYKPIELELNPFDNSVAKELRTARGTPVNVYNDNLLIKTLDDAVNKLPEQQRNIFLLRHANDLRLSEIAEIVGVKEGTVKAHLFKAISNILKYFKRVGVSIDSISTCKGDADV